MTEQDRDTVVELRGITVDYGTHRVLEGFDLAVARGELVALLGPSGSGKTTVIRTLAGFLTPTQGSLLVAGRDVTRVPPHKRGIGVVFQSYALFPHMSVVKNLAYSMKVKRLGRDQIKRRCEELLGLVRLEAQADKKPGQLSGGQQQRVALARALAMDPEVLLLDEPLSNLDANLRRDVGAEIRRLQKETGTTAIMVTHDRQEAFGMADRISVLRDGRIEQFGTPRELYRNPRTAFMAEFMGEVNLIPGQVKGADRAGLLTVDTGLGSIRATGEAATGAEVTLMIRPEDLSVNTPRPGSTFSGVVRESFFYGSNLVIDVDVDGLQISVVSSGSSSVAPRAGQAVQLSASVEDCLVLPGERA